ncbi:MAG: dihydrodipicolinate synthase family protein [Deinococcota bacterium]|nr:dihydrodipicolinate synthase family protein [Deinococcota bacterium]
MLPQADGSLAAYTPRAPAGFSKPSKPLSSRVAYAAAHVVCDPLRTAAGETHLDWEATLAFRRHLWSYGLGVAEAMDTAQRGMGLDYKTTRELIRVSVKEARACGGKIVCGAGTDQLEAGVIASLEDVINAYLEQCAFIEAQGGRAVIMASRHLAACARSPDDYAYVYERVLGQVSEPVILHWLGDMFDPALEGYWGSARLDEAGEVCLQIIGDNAAKVDGIKLSLLDHQREVAVRRRLPPGVKLYSGDDFHYDALILGDGEGHSHALLGIFDAIAPAASAAIAALDDGDVKGYMALLEPTVPLSRHIFGSPTYYYKTGLVFLAFLNGHQTHFRMVGGLESARSVLHLAELFRLADAAGLLQDVERACERMRRVLRVAGAL